MIIKNTLPFLGSLIAVMLAAGLSGLVRAEEVLATPKTMASPWTKKRSPSYLGVAAAPPPVVGAQRGR